MVEKDTTEFSRESFKEKILRQLEEGNEGRMVKQDFEKRSQEEPTLPQFLQEKEPAFTRKNGLPHIPDDFDLPTPFNKGDFGEKLKQQNDQPKEPGEVTKEDFLKASSEPYHFDKNNFDAIKKEVEYQAPLAFERPIFDPIDQPHYSRKSAQTQDEFTQGEDGVEKMPQTKRQNSKHPAPKHKNKKKNKKKKTKNTAGRIIAVIVVIFVLAAAAAGWYSYSYVKSGVLPLNPKDHTIKAINIPAGSSSKQIGSILEKDGIIRNGAIFQYYTKFKNYTGFKSGYYNLSPSMSLSSIAKDLQEGGTQKPVDPTLGKVTIPEGLTLEQIAKRITINADEKNAKTPFSEADFMKVVQDPTFIAKMATAYPNLFKSLPQKSAGVKYQLEGYLFPATYDYTKKSTVETLVTSMIEAMNTQLTPYYSQIASSTRSVNQVLSLASIVEKEANNDDDRRNVAGTFNNREAVGMTLDSNSTVLYAEGKLGDHTTLTQDATINTSLNSPYNTYLYKGAGPGPIDSPSLSSITAVLKPTQNQYYYFVADVTTGKVYFAKTLAEQNENVQTYVNAKLKK